MVEKLKLGLNTVSLKNLTDPGWRSGIAGAFLTIALGVFLAFSRLGGGLVVLSYDLRFLFKEPTCPQEAVIIYLDWKTCQELRQDPKSFDRALHAQLLDRLTADQARLVVFDIVFEKAGVSKADAELARAIKASGRVVLAAAQDLEARPEVKVSGLISPTEQFRSVAAAWGIAALEQDSIIRKVIPVSALGSNLAWTAAALAKDPAPQAAPAPGEVRWLDYYGPQGTIPNISFCEAKDQPVGFFRDKVVFVGGRPRTPHLFDQVEEFQTPLSRWGGAYFPGVEILTTAFLNLYRGECLARLAQWKEVAILIGVGLFLGIGAGASRSPRMTAGVFLTALLATLAVILWLAGRGFWFGWTPIVFVQVPCAMAWFLFAARLKHAPAKAPAPKLGKHGTVVLTPSLAQAVARIPREPQATPQIPDHTMLRSVGMGAYGEVWLARNTIGLYRAVKIVYRAAFDVAEPYEREFKGITKFMPISLSHPKLVHLLHVGRNDEEGYFYYIMEAADDEVAGATITPETYSPKSLSHVLHKRGRLSAAECLDLGIDLAAALDYLHQRQLIHRDIKPANIIYVGGVPKMADIGLVTDVQSRARETTYVGTEGYIPPEGPGTPAGDVFSLGKVLYQAATGLKVDQFPVLPPTPAPPPEIAALQELHRVIAKACASDAAARYRTAGQLLSALESLKQAQAAGPPLPSRTIEFQ